MPGATAGGQQRPGCALGLRPRTHSCRGGKLTAGHCCSSAGPPSVAARQSGRHQERPSPKGGPPRHRAGARPPREQAQLSRAEGVRGAEPGVLGDTPTAAGWPIRPRFEVRGRPTAAGGSGNAGRGGGAVVDGAWTRQAGGGPLCPAPPTPPALLQLTFCLTFVQLASVSLQRLWIVTLQAGRVGGTGGVTPTCRHWSPPATQSEMRPPHLMSGPSPGGTLLPPPPSSRQEAE